MNNTKGDERLAYPVLWSACLLAIVSVILLSFLLLYAHKNGRCTFGLPGPWRLPFVGCLYIFRMSPEPHKTLSDLAKIYGNVFFMKLGTSDVVVLNTSAVVKEALFIKGTDFSGRPDLYSFGLWTGSRSRESVMLIDFCSQYVRDKYSADFSFKSLFCDTRTLEARISITLDSLRSALQPFTRQATPFDPRVLVEDNMADFLMDNVFGSTVSRWFYREARFALRNAQSYSRTAFVGSCMDFFPFMRNIQRKQINKVASDSAKLREFIFKVYQVHCSSSLQTADYELSFATLLKDVKRNYANGACPFMHLEENVEISQETILSIITDVIFIAYEKLSASFQWCVARLAENKDFQRELHTQLDHLFQERGNRMLSLEDKSRIPILEAFILETLRTSCVFPFGIPRKTTRDTVVAGVRIPKDTTIFTNLWSCAHDSQVYDKPDEFRPSRFLAKDSNGKTILKSSSFPVFSAGDRKCLGYTFSKNVLFLLVGGMLQNFEIDLEEHELKFDLSGKYALTLKPRDYNILLRTRGYSIKTTAL